MIIESVRSVAVPGEEGKPYRKIKVSADVRTKLAPDVIRNAVSAYIREKVRRSSLAEKNSEVTVEKMK